MAVLEDIEAAILALQNERDAAIGAYKEKLAELKHERETTLAQQTLASMTDAQKDALREALNKPADQVIQANGVETNTEMGDIGATI